VEIQELITRLDEGARRLDDFAARDAGTHARSYAPGKWTGGQILAHVSDVDLNFHGRFLRAIAEPGSRILVFDHDRWMTELGGTARPIPVAMSIVRAATAGVGHYLRVLPVETLERTADHPDRGTITARYMARFLIKHREHHLGQLDAIAAGRTWTEAESVTYS
jgi:hypothetical protein